MTEKEMYKFIAFALKDMLGDEPFNNDDERFREECDSEDNDK